ncbi:MAG TPA: hypothetical protein VLM85_30840 [Polyangiaceae bacterium]|nr:hypothetical protein [Polyangiaceae bacterium]
MGKTTKRLSRPSALVRAEHGGAPVHLTKAEKSILDEALRKGEDLREEVESAVRAYGRWVLEKVFGDNAGAALDDGSKNAIWQELLRRAGGPTLRISRRALYSAVRIAALDRRLTTQAWQELDSGRKELLLPLRAPPLLLEAAKQVSAMDMSQAKTREYVTSLMQKDGRARQVRLTARGLSARVRKFHQGLDGAALGKRLGTLRASLKPTEREALLREVEAVRKLLGDVARAMR